MTLIQSVFLTSRDELEYDTLPNQILKTTLRRLRDAAKLNRNTRIDVHDLLRWLEPVQCIELRADHFRRIQLHRNNRIYGFLLQICGFIHEQWLPDEAGSGNQFREFEKKCLAPLFEGFVLNFYRRELPKGWNVHAPKIDWQLEHFNADAKSYLPQMKTDVCLRGPNRAIILDTKFYVQALKSSQYGTPKLPPDNLYQLFTYLRQRSSEQGWEKAEGILLYPKTTQDFAVDFVTHGHRVRALTVDLSSPTWQAIHDDLIKIMEN